MSARHGAGPSPGEARLYTRAELPAWVRPTEHAPSNTSLFYGWPDANWLIWQVVFAIDARGAIFLDLVSHGRRTNKRMPPGDLASLPGCVLIAVGVEQIRRARGGS